ncbi:MAG: TetR/AcrR family transcriptional regulator [Candidatus Marinimicrobia bacterium]|nr:TetR/AcrR family transcriptional regulator [Candidatus Neomarinimicrobiota bacterium]
MNPTPPTEDKRQRIIQAAVMVFARNGLERGKIADIANEAGIGKGTVYEYFSSKEDIFIALVEGFFTEMFHDMDALLAMGETPVEKITSLIEYSFKFLEEYLDSEEGESWPIIMEIFSQAIRADASTEMHQAIIRGVRAGVAVFEPILQDGVKASILKPFDIDYFALVVFAALDGLALHYYLQRERFDIKELMITTREIFLNGMLTATGRKELQS